LLQFSDPGSFLPQETRITKCHSVSQ